jgi:hypothetical protein
MPLITTFSILRNTHGQALSLEAWQKIKLQFTADDTVNIAHILGECVLRSISSYECGGM